MIKQETTQERPRQSRKRRSAAAVLLSLAVIAAACGSDDSASDTTGADDTSVENTDASDDTAVDDTTVEDSTVDTAAGETPSEAEGVVGGSATYLLPFPAPSPGWDPATLTVNGPNTMPATAVFDALAIETPSDGSIALRLLESAESEDGTTWTLRLLPDLVFSDDTPLNAEAIQYNWERLADPATGAVAGPAAQTIASMDVIDDVTLEVTLAKPNGQFPYTIASNALTWIGSPTALEADPEGFAMSPVGAGAYVVDSFDPTTEAVLTRSPSYHGVAYLDEVTFRLIPDEAQRFATFDSGDAELLYTASPAGAKTLFDAGYQATSVNRSGGFAMFFNMAKAPFDDIRARQALSLVYDSVTATNSLFGEGVIDPIENPVVENSPFYDADQNQLSPDNAQAQALFDELAEENGGPLDIVISHGAPIFSPEAEWLQTKLSSFDNVNVSLEPVDSATFFSKYSGGDYTVGIFSFAWLDPDGMAQFLATGGSLNFMKYSNPRVDELLEQGRAELDQEARVAIYQEVMDLVLEELPIHWIHRTLSWQFYSEGIEGMGVENMISSYGQPDVSQIWLTE